MICCWSRAHHVRTYFRLTDHAISNIRTYNREFMYINAWKTTVLLTLFFFNTTTLLTTIPIILPTTNPIIAPTTNTTMLDYYLAALTQPKLSSMSKPPWPLKWLLLLTYLPWPKLGLLFFPDDLHTLQTNIASLLDTHNAPNNDDDAKMDSIPNLSNAEIDDFSLEYLPYRENVPTLMMTTGNS